MSISEVIWAATAAAIWGAGVTVFVTYIRDVEIEAGHKRMILTSFGVGWTMFCLGMHELVKSAL